MSDTEHVNELTSSNHEQLVLPGTIERAVTPDHDGPDEDEGQDEEQSYVLM